MDGSRFARSALGFALLTLAAHAFPDSTSYYTAAILPIYGPHADALIAAKAAYRDAHPDIDWLSDYSRIHATVPVVRCRARRDARGQFSWTSQTITLFPDADLDTLRHELGHALQREPQADASHRVAYFEGRTRGAHSRFLYLSHPNEWEVRLQGLNRVAAADGHPILTPRDAATLLVRLGVSRSAVNHVLAARLNLPPVAAAADKTLIARARAEFRSGHELVELLDLAHCAGRHCAHDLIARVLREAPGHL